MIVDQQPIIHNAHDRAAVLAWIDRRIGETHEKRARELSKFEHRVLSKVIDELLLMRTDLCGNPKNPFVA